MTGKPSRLRDSSGGDEQTNGEEGEREAGCCCRLLHTIWHTRDTHPMSNSNARGHAKATLRELLTYCCFLAVVTVVVHNRRTITMYRYSSVMTKLFVDAKIQDTGFTFKTVRTVDELWQFINGPLMSGLFSNNDSSSSSNFTSTSPASTSNMSSSSSVNVPQIFYESFLIGSPRLRQIRVRNGSCLVADGKFGHVSGCFPDFAASVESRDSFGPGNDTVWTFNDESADACCESDGFISSYPAGGFVADIGVNESVARQRLRRLFDMSWLNRGSRALLVDFSVFNANVNFFCVARLTAELPAVGGVFTSWQFRTVRLLRYVELLDWVVAAFECVFVVFLAYFLMEEALEIRQLRLRYFARLWNCMDCLVLALGGVCVGFHVYVQHLSHDCVLSLLSSESDAHHADLGASSYWNLQLNRLSAIMVFASWVKLFKYLSFSATLSQLSRTLGSCARDLLGFSAMFSIVFAAFAQSGHLLFGACVEDFNSVFSSVFTLLRILLGDFNFNQLVTAHSVLGPIYFLLYVFFVFFVLTNMFLAIINETYAEVKTSGRRQDRDCNVRAFVEERLDRLISRLDLPGARDADIREAVRMADVPGGFNVEVLRQELRRRGHADADIECLIDRFDSNGLRQLDEAGRHKIRCQLLLNGEEHEEDEDTSNAWTRRHKKQQQQQKPEKDLRPPRRAPPESPTSADFVRLSARVGSVERGVLGLVDRLDAALQTVERMERRRLETVVRLRRAASQVAAAASAADAERIVRSVIG